MANKAQSTPSNNKKPGKTLKEKRLAKHEKGRTVNGLGER